MRRRWRWQQRRLGLLEQLKLLLQLDQQFQQFQRVIQQLEQLQRFIQQLQLVQFKCLQLKLQFERLVQLIDLWKQDLQQCCQRTYLLERPDLGHLQRPHRSRIEFDPCYHCRAAEPVRSLPLIEPIAAQSSSSRTLRASLHCTTLN